MLSAVKLRDYCVVPYLFFRRSLAWSGLMVSLVLRDPQK